MLDACGREITYLRLSVTERCNLRCRYCAPESEDCPRRDGEMLTNEEMLTAVCAAASLGFRKLRITGGEPLLRPDIVPLCETLSAVEGIEELCLTTNATLLPPIAHALYAAGVKRLNISLDTLDAEKYRRITRIGHLDDALRGIEAALAEPFARIKLNSVLIGGFNDDEIAALSAITLRLPVDLRFIELMPMGAYGFDAEAYLPCKTVLERLPALEPAEADGGVARRYRLPGALGCIGLISPLSEHFCASCNRMRLTADGKLKPCLHAPAELSIKGLDEAGMREQFMRAIEAKPLWHGELSGTSPSRAHRSMNRIGG